MKLAKLILLLAIIFVSLTACVSTANGPDGEVSDPYEGWNRSVFAFNKAIDRNFLDPITGFYDENTPEPIKDGVSNVVNNVRQPFVLGNAVLQANPTSAGDTLVRLILNTTLGIGGLFDVATSAGIPLHQEDFGQTLGVWGVGPGPHLEIPFLGPSNPRDFVGFAASFFGDPVTIVVNNELGFGAVVGVVAVDTLESRRRLDSAIDGLYQQKDPYAFARSAYRQTREFAICNGRCPTEGVEDDLFDDLEDEDYEDGADDGASKD